MARATTMALILMWAAGFDPSIAARARADEPAKPVDPAAVEFFEAKVRPLLLERCGSCHANGKAKGGLKLDSLAEAIAGGPTGPAVVPGKPGESLLIEAINYGDNLQMPPKSKLPAEEIATLTRWVESGAPWPVGAGSGSASGSGAKVKPFNLRERAGHWSWQPVRDPSPPEVKDASWPINPVDRFLLAKLEAKGLKPAGDADKATLIRRVTFDLIGLPPIPAEVDAFLADEAPDAYEKVVDRLLASTHHGERMARAWLDLVRFAETSGHEFDYEIPAAYRYRDYLIRAFNKDVPYDQFVVEHVAGDLLPGPRRNPDDGTNESVLATGFFRLHEGVHSPVDLKDDGAAKVDNQVDVFSKTFLALTVACARCHDHKFDAITTRDYYALAGFLSSSRHSLAFLDPPAKIRAKVDELEKLRRDLAATRTDPRPAPAPVPVGKDDMVFEDFNRADYAGWFVNGEAFGAGPTAPDAWKVIDGRPTPLVPGVAHSGAVSNRLRGVLRSKTFTIDKKSIQLLASGKGGRINVVIDGFEKIRAPIYGDLVVDVNHGDAWKWIAIDASSWLGHPAYLELDDGATVDFTGNQGVIRDGKGYLAVDEIRFSERGGPPPLPDRATAARFSDEQMQAVAPLLARFAEVEKSIPEPTLGQALTDGTGIDTRVHIRGSTKSLGEPVPRRFLEVLTDPSIESASEGSGRLDLARRLVEPGNPLTARVLVNRLWHHHFGRGIVPSVDDFGVMGRDPTHPDLLDYLARRFVASGWSIKAMHRLIVTSHAYRMSSGLTPEADRIDPTNELWHRRDLRRLDAEAIRDTLLAVSGRLDRTMYGPSVAPHLTPFMDGRGRPGRSGPLDGDGRRTLYLNVRRNFLNPMLLAFDFPSPSSTMGRRNVSNVPAQALTLMNDPFILDQARFWAARVRSDPNVPPPDSVNQMYREAFGRSPSETERTAALAFLDEQARSYGKPDDSRSWADLAHVLFNVKEFVVAP